MKFEIILFIILWIILISICNNMFSKRKKERIGDIVISNKFSFLVSITVVLLFVFLIYEIADIAFTIGGIFFFILPVVITVLNNPIVIISFNDKNINVEYLMGENKVFNYNDIIMAWKENIRYSKQICVCARDSSNPNSDIPVKFRFNYYSKNRRKFINKLIEKGVIVK